MSEGAAEGDDGCSGIDRNLCKERKVLAAMGECSKVVDSWVSKEDNRYGRDMPRRNRGWSSYNMHNSEVMNALL